MAKVLLISISLVFFIFPPFVFSGTGNRLALVIGNEKYFNAPLKNPLNDARDMYQALKDLGFNVIYKENVGYREMEKAVREFGNRLRKQGGAGLFYFAGHGVQVNGRNYLIPVDAQIESESDVQFEALDASRVLGKMNDAGNGLNFVILDACRDNPFARSFRSYNKGLAQMDAPKGTLIAYATSPGKTAADGDARNGVYTKYLLKQMRIPGLEVGRMFRRVRKGVSEETGGTQVSWESTSLTGEFYFCSSKPAKTEKQFEEKTSIKSSALLAEKEAWGLAKNTDDIQIVKMFLEQYPNGNYAFAARMKKKELERKAQKEAERLAKIQSRPSPSSSLRKSYPQKEEQAHFNKINRNIVTLTQADDINPKEGIIHMEIPVPTGSKIRLLSDIVVNHNGHGGGAFFISCKRVFLQKRGRRVILRKGKVYRMDHNEISIYADGATWMKLEKPFRLEVIAN